MIERKSLLDSDIHFERANAIQISLHTPPCKETTRNGGSVPKPPIFHDISLVGANSCALWVCSRRHMNEEISYKLIKIIEENPDISQRELAIQMGISLGKVNYCLKAMIEKGWLKACNFKNSYNKIAYAYMLTPKGLGEKAKITARFLKRKVREYELLKNEIEQLRQEISGSS